MQCFSIESDTPQLLYAGDELVLGGIWMLYASNENGKFHCSRKLESERESERDCAINLGIQYVTEILLAIKFIKKLRGKCISFWISLRFAHREAS